jgi:hypothetical protein
MCTKVKCSGQKPACGRCTDLSLYCKYEISRVGKVTGQTCRGKGKAPPSNTRNGSDQADVAATADLRRVLSPPASTADTVMVAPIRSPQQPATGIRSQSQSLGSLARTPSSFASRESEDCFELGPGGEFGFIQLQDVNLSLGDQPIGDTGVGVDDQHRGQWYASAQEDSCMGERGYEAFENSGIVVCGSEWAAQDGTIQGPNDGTAVSVPNILTPSDPQPPPGRRTVLRQSISDRPISDHQASHKEVIEHMTACIDVIQTLVLKETAMLDTLDVILSDCKQQIARLGRVIQEDEFDQSITCSNLVYTALSLVISRMERCIATSHSADVDMTAQPRLTTSPSGEFETELQPKQKSHFRCPLPSISFGALEYQGKEQLIFCSNLMQTEVSRCLRLVRLLERPQAGGRKFQSHNSSTAKIADLWCRDFTARLQYLLQLLEQAQDWET